MNPYARKRRRARQVMGGSAFVAFIPVFEVLGRHGGDSWLALLTPEGLSHVGPVLMGALGVAWSARIHREATVEESYRSSDVTGE